MATGTEGPDSLANDPSNPHDVVNALGGDDVITVQKPSPTMNSGESIDVNGGSGFDTLIVNMPGQRVQGLGGSGFDGSANFRDGMGIYWLLSWTSIERLEITGALFFGSGGGGFSTGDSVDILRFGTPNSNFGGGNGTIATNGGNDEIYISGQPFFAGTGGLTVNSGTGNDVVDFSALEMPGGLGWTANGGDGDDTLRGSIFRDILRGDGGNDSLSLWARLPASTTDVSTRRRRCRRGRLGQRQFLLRSGSYLGRHRHRRRRHRYSGDPGRLCRRARPFGQRHPDRGPVDPRRLEHQLRRARHPQLRLFDHHQRR